MGSVAESKVTGIVQSLNTLEDDLDSLNSKVADMKKQLTVSTQSEMDSMLEKTRQMATQETEVLVNASKEKATAKSLKISQEADAKLAEIRSNIDANFDEAVKHVVSTVLKAQAQISCLLLRYMDPLLGARIGVATTCGRNYYRFLTCLRSLKLRFDSILPENILDYSGSLILTTHKESPKECKKPLLYEDILDHLPAVTMGIMLQKLNLHFEEQDLVLGIDPGKLIGLSASYYGREIECSFHSSIEDLILSAIGILGGLRAKRKIVKIGNGDMSVAQEIASMLNLKFCSSFDLEFIDEQRTSLKIKNHNQRGKRDMLSARYISRRDGTLHSILPLSITGQRCKSATCN